MYEFNMRIPKGKHTDVAGGGLRFCKPAFFKVLVLPETASELVCVVTEEAVGDGCLPITRPTVKTLYFYGAIGSERRSNLKEIEGNYLYHATKKTLAKFYDKGARFIHFEYVD